MDQNQPADNDLQKAIDDIANTTNQDPVFSDPVAAPSSVPEGDTGELAEAIGPFPAPEPEPAPAPVAPAPTLEMVTPAPEPIAPIEGLQFQISRSLLLSQLCQPLSQHLLQ